MEKRLDFRFEIPRRPEGPLVEFSAAEAEKLLLKRLEDAKEDPKEALWQIAQFYKNAKQHEKALRYLRRLMALLPDVEEKANCFFTMGQPWRTWATMKRPCVTTKRRLRWSRSALFFGTL